MNLLFYGLVKSRKFFGGAINKIYDKATLNVAVFVLM